MTRQEAVAERDRLQAEYWQQRVDHQARKRADWTNPFTDPTFIDLTTIINHSDGQGSPDWSDELPKEATRDPNDQPITDTKISAALQDRRVYKSAGGWYVTLQNRAEWREHYAARIAVLRRSIAAIEDNVFENGEAALERVVSLSNIPPNVMESATLLLEAMRRGELKPSKYRLEADKIELAALIAGGTDA